MGMVEVSTIHGVHGGDAVTCAGEIHSYRYRFYAPSDSFYERCVVLAWCYSREHLQARSILRLVAARGGDFIADGRPGRQWALLPCTRDDTDVVQAGGAEADDRVPLAMVAARSNVARWPWAGAVADSVRGA
ncbi:hypothetical protein ABZ793_30975 [Micromonospora sp. NPDC047465]|uniref:hypothetical protein n=1 Tax=Micromonospora sp. NPDC047465 TaxID=3154813 RepID=UPI0033D84850